jgi:hypothetical protein
VAETKVEEARSILTPSSEVESDLERLRSMVEQSDVEDARAFVKELEARWPDSEPVRRWARVLAPPVARRRPGRTGRSYAREDAWIRDHGGKYPGCWLAVHGDRLIAADPDFAEVLAAVRRTTGSGDALFHYQPHQRVDE